MAGDDKDVSGAIKAAAKLPESHDRAVDGEEPTMLRDGPAVAPAEPAQAATTPDSRRQIITAMRRLSEGKRLEDGAVGELIAEGRR